MVPMSSKSKVRKEKYPLPEDSESIIALVRSILEGGRVQRIELDINGPVRVLREVEIEDPDLVEPDINLDAALRNTEMIEYSSEGAESFQVLVDMMLLAQSKRPYCICWATGAGEYLIPEWLELEARGMRLMGVDTLLGLPIHRLRSLPDDTLILCASSNKEADPAEVNFAVKTDIEIRSEDGQARLEQEAVYAEHPIPGRPIDDPIRAGPQRGPAAASELALTAGRLNTVEFKRTGNSGK